MLSLVGTGRGSLQCRAVVLLALEYLAGHLKCQPLCSLQILAHISGAMLRMPSPTKLGTCWCDECSVSDQMWRHVGLSAVVLCAADRHNSVAARLPI